MMCGINLHHGVAQGDNVGNHGIVDGPLSFQEGVQLPLGDIRREIRLIFGWSRNNLDFFK